MKNSQDTVTQITQGLFAGDTAFFFGAGASASSGAPLWTKLRDDLMKEAFSEIVTEEEQLEEFKKKFKIADNIEILKYPEVVFSMAKAVFGVGYLEKFLGAHYRNIVPDSDTYNVMENLVRWGFARDVFTTNQDALFEKKFDQSDIPYIKIIPRFCDEKDKEKSSDVKIHSLHGDWKTHGSILSDIQQIIPSKGAADVYNNYEIFKVEKALLSYRTLVVIGYGGLDCDIQFLFKKYLKRGRIIWLCYGGDVPEIGDDLKSGIDFVKITDSDNFFNELEKGIRKDHNCSNVMKNSITRIEQAARQPECSIEGYGSVCLGGDYGVYKNGRMVQYTHNMKTVFSAFKSEHFEIITKYPNPFSGEIINVNEDRNRNLEDAVRSCFITSKLPDLRIEIISEYPLDSGLGDPEPAGLTRLFIKMGILPVANAWEFFKKIANSKPYYPHTSYLRPLASLLPAGIISVMKRGDLPENCQYGDVKWQQINSNNVKIQSIECGIVSNEEPIFGICYSNRKIYPIKLQFSSTGHGTKMNDEMKKSLCEGAAEIEEKIEDSIINHCKIDFLGKQLNEVFDLFHSFAKISDHEKDLFSKIDGNICMGAKLSGSGPGGAYCAIGRKEQELYDFGCYLSRTLFPYIEILETSYPHAATNNLIKGKIQNAVKPGSKITDRTVWIDIEKMF